MGHTYRIAATLLALLVGASCTAPTPEDGEFADFATGKADGVGASSPEALAVLALVNNPEVDVDELDFDARLNAIAARNIIAHRDGMDLRPKTSDDNRFDTLKELDDVRYVGPSAFAALLDYAVSKGLLNQVTASAEVIFSPQPLASSHSARIAQLIDQAETSIDIAMYSYSSSDIGEALEAAVARGIEVRFIFETARTKDKRLSGDDLLSSKSGRLERAGVDVRYVNKINHHKFILVDGPRDDLKSANHTKIASGSANWSSGGASIYDENTLFLGGVPEIALKFQREFNRMWTHSKDLVANTNIETRNASLSIEDADIQDHPDQGVYFSSANFDISDSNNTTFRLRSREDMAVSDQWVQAIEDADTSIWIASGHMRLRPVAEALIAKKQANPDFDIRVYVDQQEYMSFSGNQFQLERRERCLDTATTANKVFDCENKSFLWAKAIGEAGIETRYKYYSYRWHFSYAKQMHNKFMIIDSDELYTGSYNLSVNAEHSTFENVIHLKAPSFGGVIGSYVDYFEQSFDTGRGEDQLTKLRGRIQDASSIPLVFESMALTHAEASALKSLIRDQCPDVDSDSFRSSPQTHKFCQR